MVVLSLLMKLPFIKKMVVFNLIVLKLFFFCSNFILPIYRAFFQIVCVCAATAALCVCVCAAAVCVPFTGAVCACVCVLPIYRGRVFLCVRCCYCCVCVCAAHI